MRLIFHGKLRDLFGTDAVMQVNTIADAVEGYSRQVDWPRDMLIEIVGVDNVKDYAEEVHLMPALVGGGGKFGSILLGVALVAISFIPGVGPALATSLLVSGGLMVAQGVIGLFLKSPTLKGGVADPEASKYLPVNKNTTAVNTPITMAWGRIILAGQWLSLQSDSTNLSYGVFPSTPS